MFLSRHVCPVCGPIRDDANPGQYIDCWWCIESISLARAASSQCRSQVMVWRHTGILWILEVGTPPRFSFDTFRAFQSRVSKLWKSLSSSLYRVVAGWHSDNLARIHMQLWRLGFATNTRTFPGIGGCSFVLLQVCWIFSEIKQYPALVRHIEGVVFGTMSYAYISYSGNFFINQGHSNSLVTSPSHAYVQSTIPLFLHL